MDRRLAQAAGKRLAAGLVFFWLVGAPALASDPWRQDRPCGKPHASMIPANQPGCYRRWCADTRLGELCACAKETPGETDFSVGRHAWKAPVIPPMGGDASHFRVDDADGQLLVAMLASESVGIAISNWFVWALDGERVSQPLEVQNYGTLSFATKGTGSRACRLLAARWQSGSEPRRGPGTYVSGSWYAIERGEFVPVLDRPLIYRRYLLSVERARYAAESEQRPFAWFRSATTRAPHAAAVLFQPQAR